MLVLSRRLREAQGMGRSYLVSCCFFPTSHCNLLALMMTEAMRSTKTHYHTVVEKEVRTTKMNKNNQEKE